MIQSILLIKYDSKILTENENVFHVKVTPSRTGVFNETGIILLTGILVIRTRSFFKGKQQQQQQQPKVLSKLQDKFLEMVFNKKKS